MKSNTLIAFFLIYLFAGTKAGLCTHDSNVPPEYNIARPAKVHLEPTIRLRGKKSVGDIIRDIFKRRNPIPPVIYEKIHPPMDFYLDPPRFSRKDKSRLA
jgi:hypothetical protein